MPIEQSEFQTVKITNGNLTAGISERGAELVLLQDEAGRDLLWSGDPAYWNGRAPLLFPVVGRLKGDHCRVDGTDYPMRQHGLARISRFTVTAREPAMCRFELRSDSETRKAYPFDFVFKATYRLDGRTLDMAITVRNLGDRPMPAAMGFHPAFRWPLPYGGERADHALTFEHEEPAPIHKVVGGLLAPHTRPSPLAGRTLALRDDLFTDDALVFLGQNSRAVHHAAPGRRGLTVTFPTMPDLGIWTKPGAPFICIEPWSGYASPADFDGELAHKPGMSIVPPGGEQRFGMAVTLDAP